MDNEKKNMSLSKSLLILLLVLYALLIALVIAEGGFPVGLGVPALVMQTLVTPMFLILFLPIALHPIVLGAVLIPVVILLWRHHISNIVIAIVAGIMLASFAVSMPVRVRMSTVSQYQSSGSEDLRVRYGYPLRFVEQTPYGRNREQFMSTFSTPREHETNILWPQFFITCLFWSVFAYGVLLIAARNKSLDSAT